MTPVEEPPTPDDLKRRARAARAYSGKTSTWLAKQTGIEARTLEGLLGPRSKTAPTVEQAWKIAAACDVPLQFINEGWSVIERTDELAAELRLLEARVVTLEAEVHERNDDTGHSTVDQPR